MDFLDSMSSAYRYACHWHGLIFTGTYTCTYSSTGTYCHTTAAIPNANANAMATPLPTPMSMEFSMPPRSASISLSPARASILTHGSFEWPPRIEYRRNIVQVHICFFVSNVFELLSLLVPVFAFLNSNPVTVQPPVVRSVLNPERTTGSSFCCLFYFVLSCSPKPKCRRRSHPRTSRRRLRKN